MNLHDVLRAGRSGFVYTAIGIVSRRSPSECCSLACCAFPEKARLSHLGRHRNLRRQRNRSGGTHHPKRTMRRWPFRSARSFILNSVALLTFPFIGTGGCTFSKSQFGLWAALAIHDTSSVVGACAKYGAQALAIGTTVKLARALWIVPLALVNCGASAQPGASAMAVVHFCFSVFLLRLSQHAARK